MVASVDTNLFLNVDQIIGGIIPSVYISRIVLEGGGSRPDPRKTDRVRIHAHDTGAGQTQRAQRPTSLEEEAELKTKVTLVIKDTYRDGTFSWFGSLGLDIKDFIKIRLIQTTDIAATEILSAQDVLHRHVIWNNPVLRTGNTTYQEFDFAEFEGDQNDVTKHYKEIDNNGNIIFSMSKEVTGTDLPNTFGPVPGRTIRTNTDHLAYFAYAYIDLASTVPGHMHLNDGDWNPEFNVFLNTSQLTLTRVGRATSDIVIKDGKTVSNAYVFETKDGTLWTGDIYNSNNTWFGGKRNETLNPPELVRKTVTNKKIQDFRISKVLEKLTFNFSNLENKFLTFSPKYNTSTSIIKRKIPFFTDMLLSRDKDGNCRFFFGIDMLKLVRENSEYGKLYTGNVAPDEILNNAWILSMKIFRVRLKGSSQAGSSPTEDSNSTSFGGTFGTPKLKNFNAGGMMNNGILGGYSFTQRGTDIQRRSTPNQLDELIIEAKESIDPARRFDVVRSDHNNSWVRRIGNSTQFYGHDANQEEGVTYFMGTDASISNLNDGYYRYRIELEIEDRSVTYLAQQRDILKEAKKDLAEYYELGSKLGITGEESDRWENPHIADGGRQSIASNSVPANFDPIANRFTRQFYNEVASYYSAGPEPWISIPLAYLTVISKFVDGIDNPATDPLYAALSGYIDPISGSLQGVMVLLNLIKDFENILNRAIGTTRKNIEPATATTGAGGRGNPSPGVATMFDTNIANQGSPKIQSFKTNNEFSSVFNASIPSNLGYDFMGLSDIDISSTATSSDPTSGAGLRIIRGQAFRGIVANETGKLWRLAPSNPGLDPKSYTYFTPTIIKTRGGTLTTTGDWNSISPSQWANLDINALRVANNDYFREQAGQGFSHLSDSAKQTFWQWVAGQGSLLEGKPGHFLLTGGGTSQGETGYHGADSYATNVPENLSTFFNSYYNLVAVPTTETEVQFEHQGQQPPSTINRDPLAFYNESALEQLKCDWVAFSIYWDLFSTGLSVQGFRPSVKLPDAAFNQKNIAYYENLISNAIEFQGLPNQIKALIMLFDQSGTTIGDNVTEPTTAIRSLFGGELNDFLLRPGFATSAINNPFQNPDEKTRIRIFCETINVLEVFTGYGVVSSGDSLGVEKSVGRPEWTPLTRQLYNNKAPGQYLICRLRPYENEKMKIKRDPNLELPVFDEHFLLNVGQHSRYQSSSQKGNKGTKARTGLSLTLDDPQYQRTNLPISEGGS